jgi:hypothetical protein
MVPEVQDPAPYHTINQHLAAKVDTSRHFYPKPHDIVIEFK